VAPDSGQCRRGQANKYGIKGSRVATVRKLLTLLMAAEERHGTTARLAELAPDLVPLAGLPHLALIELPTPGGGMIRHLDVCGRKTPFTASIKTARQTVERLADEYGQRALQAERNEGVDWKALSHAVRVGREALELFRTGRITLPLPDADHIRRIKLGELPYDVVGSEIEGLLDAVEAAAAATTLPAEADQGLIDRLVGDAYRGKIVGSR
jgi:hypothetical protein